MSQKHPQRSLRDLLATLRDRGELTEVRVPVDPNLEIAEIHRRVTASGGPALLFSAVKGSPHPVVTNLFGTLDRVALSFGERPGEFIQDAVEAARTLMPPTVGKLWGLRRLVRDGLRVGTRSVHQAPVLEEAADPVDLGRLPVLTCWHSDGGPFFTLPLVYTEHPDTGVSNLGMYRMQVHSPDTTGMHFQIHKGGGFHLHVAERRAEPLPATVFLGGPPALILAAVTPLPEDIPELLFASLLLGERLPRVHREGLPHPLVAEAEFALVGQVLPGTREPEGPFGDHYGYNSKREDYPVFRVQHLLHRKDAIFPATVVGRPRQEDFHIGVYLQEILSPLFEVVMPSVRKLWSYPEAGFHSLAAAVVRDRYPREALASGFRILGEGQLSLTKCLLLTDQDVDLRDWRSLLVTILERIDWGTDLHVFDQVAQDSLDYTGPETHRGSKAILLGLGPVRRKLPVQPPSELPAGTAKPRVHAPGCLVLEGTSYPEETEQAARVAAHPGLADWPLIILVDDAEEATRSDELFLWSVFTRMEPAADIKGRAHQVARFHVGLEAPVVFDCRMKPWYPEVLEVDEESRKLVDRRWDEYGLGSVR